MESREEQLEMITDFISKHKNLDKYEIWEYNTYYTQKKQLKSTEVPLEEGRINELKNSQYLHDRQVVSGLIGDKLGRTLIVLVGKADDSIEEIMKDLLERPKGEIKKTVFLYVISIFILTGVFYLTLEPFFNDIFWHLYQSIILALMAILITIKVFKEMNKG